MTGGIAPRTVATVFACLLASWGSCSGAQAIATVPITGLDARMPGQQTAVLVLGSAHLSALPEDVAAEKSIEPVIDRLAAFAPDVITIEALPGEACDGLARHVALYGKDVFDSYCLPTDAARAATGLDVPAALGEAKQHLASWPAQPTAAQRRHLAAVFLAAGEPASALVQWWRLAPQERRAGDGLDDAMIQFLDKRAHSRNENYLVGARLAARLGLERVHAVDDHTGDSVDLGDEAAYERAIRAAWKSGETAAAPIRAKQAELEKAGDLIGLYRHVNDPRVLRIAIDSDFGAAMRDASPDHYGRRYVAGWEARNLRMVANVRAAFATRPGGRVLCIVGASHKPWFDALLGQMQGVRLVDAVQVLRPAP
jgi:hypothetical protein